MSIENRENMMEGLISHETKSRINLEKHLLGRNRDKPLSAFFGAATTMAVAKRINPEAAKNLGLF